MIGVPALLQLVDWYAARGQNEPPGGSSCVDLEQPVSPPRPSGGKPPSPLSQLWRVLTADQRQAILKALSRVVAEHLGKPPLPREVTHEGR